MNEVTMDQTLNVGSEITLAEGIVKHIKIGTIGLIRQVRQNMKGISYRFSQSIGREKWESSEGTTEIDWPSVEAAYRKTFDLVLVEGLSDEEYEQVNDEGIKELENLMERFL
ncbi:hypothetical protein [Paenibacillus sinopodophylli]|uniref:hypothetical protein n=1 Tax=Paenibacillus sinopodophylli TaxID=1837342 RepID=UPI00110CD143|nr:hypothetical protein [Paenibacillus sinopodophylli]